MQFGGEGRAELDKAHAACPIEDDRKCIHMIRQHHCASRSQSFCSLRLRYSSRAQI